MSDDELIEAALAAQGRAYAPYSRFNVGAAVLADGKIVSGANVENASYGLAICAERNAIARAVFEGAKGIDVVVVATDVSPPASPCGACRQVMMEFADDPAAQRVILVNPAGERRDFTLADLLPHGFRPSDLAKEEG